MSDEETGRACVLIPVSAEETWVVPQNCLAEVLTLQTTAEQPPAQVHWRGRDVQVLDFGAEDDAPWSDPRRTAGLMAIFLGLEGEGCEYWAVAIRGDGLATQRIRGSDVKDAPESVTKHATAAFNYHDLLCQVPDLDGLQKQVSALQPVA